jgi:hypothetical protein
MSRLSVISGNSIILKDNVLYSPVTFANEKEFELLVVDHINDIFGEGTKYYPKRTIKSLANNRSIPDGFVIDAKNKKWYILEFKLLCNDAIDRIPRQIKNYQNAVKHLETIKNIYVSINEISENVSDFILTSQPEIVIIINSLDGEMGDQFEESINEDIPIIVFKTYSDNRTGSKKVLLHLFNPLPKRAIGTKTTKDAEDILQMADKNGVGKDFRKIHETAIELGIRVQPKKYSIMYTPPKNGTFMLFTVWANDSSHKLKMWSLADRFTEYIPVNRKEVIAALGQDIHGETITGNEVNDYIKGLKKLLKSGFKE